MSKKTKDSKGLDKTKTINAGAKPSRLLAAKGAVKQPALVVKIPPASARRPADKPVVKETKSGPPPAAESPATALPKRKLGLRGAAPWAARHAAKHAAEARARAAEPPPPGSARATIRVPRGAEELKAKIGELHNALLQIRSYRKNLNKGFFDIGGVLRDIQQRKLYEAKGYGSFEAFLEREIDLGKITALKLIKVSSVFAKPAALEYGMEKLFQSLQVLDASAETTATKSGPAPSPVQPSSSPRLALPLKPPLGRVG
jgi:hypothetical protein